MKKITRIMLILMSLIQSKSFAMNLSRITFKTFDDFVTALPINTIDSLQQVTIQDNRDPVCYVNSLNNTQLAKFISGAYNNHLDNLILHLPNRNVSLADLRETLLDQKKNCFTRDQLNFINHYLENNKKNLSVAFQELQNQLNTFVISPSTIQLGTHFIDSDLNKKTTINITNKSMVDFHTDQQVNQVVMTLLANSNNSLLKVVFSDGKSIQQKTVADFIKAAEVFCHESGSYGFDNLFSCIH